MVIGRRPIAVGQTRVRRAAMVFRMKEEDSARAVPDPAVSRFRTGANWRTLACARVSANHR
jgi:hypothetical protein